MMGAFPYQGISVKAEVNTYDSGIRWFRNRDKCKIVKNETGRITRR